MLADKNKWSMSLLINIAVLTLILLFLKNIMVVNSDDSRRQVDS